IRDNLALTELMIGDKNPKFTTAGLAYLSPRLTFLGLAGAWMTDESLDAVIKLPKLDRIGLVQTQVTEKGVGRLLQRYPDLKQLILTASRITDQVMPALAGCHSLQQLELSGLPITDAGLKSLHGLIKLQSIDLTKTKVTPEGVRTLQTALPK